MKEATFVLLAVIAAGVAYLAWNQYEQRRAALDLAERLSDPDAYTAKQWAERAGLQCDLVWNVQTVTTAGGFLRPMRFICAQRMGSPVQIEDVDCPEPSLRDSPGGRTVDGYYKPMHSICWKASQPIVSPQ